jgi:predicted dehydrogenase
MLTVGLVGAGFMAKAYLDVLFNNEMFEVVGIVGRDRSRTVRLAAQYGALEVFDSIDALFVGSRPNALIIAVSEPSIVPVCLEAFQYPWFILVEKPLGLSAADADTLVDHAQRNLSNVFVGLNRRFFPSTRRALDEIQEFPGQRLVTVFDQENPQPSLHPTKDSKVFSRWMYANSIHVIDYFQIFCRGNLKRVDIQQPWRPDNPGYVVAFLEYSSGDIGIYQAVWNGPGPWGVYITTPDRRWELRPLEFGRYQDRYERLRIPFDTNEANSRMYKLGIEEQVFELAKACAGEIHMLPRLEEGRRTMHLIEKIYGI